MRETIIAAAFVVAGCAAEVPPEAICTQVSDTHLQVSCPDGWIIDCGDEYRERYSEPWHSRPGCILESTTRGGLCSDREPDNLCGVFSGGSCVRLDDCPG